MFGGSGRVGIYTIFILSSGLQCTELCSLVSLEEDVQHDERNPNICGCSEASLINELCPDRRIPVNKCHISLLDHGRNKVPEPESPSSSENWPGYFELGFI